jgi:LuxR family maltose regulon positive regulatory protein
LGQLLYEWNRLAEARENLEKALQLAQQSGEVKVLIYSHRTLARLHLVKNQVDAAQSSLGAADDIAGQTNIVSLVEDVAIDRMLLWCKEKRVDTAAGWAQTSGYTFDFERPESKENAVLIRLALAQSLQQNAPLADEVLSLLQQRYAHEQEIEHTWQLIQNLVLLAIAHKAVGDKTAAIETFKQALSLAQPAGFIRTIVDEGEVVAGLLHHCVDDEDVGEYASELLSTFGDGQAVPTRAPHPPVSPQPLIEPLRQRELEVLRCISAGYSNQEIAEEMVLAVSTVKWHLKNIYGKLQVNRRTQAVAKAKELGLL